MDTFEAMQILRQKKHLVHKLSKNKFVLDDDYENPITGRELVKQAKIYTSLEISNTKPKKEIKKKDKLERKLSKQKILNENYDDFSKNKKVKNVNKKWIY